MASAPGSDQTDKLNGSLDDGAYLDCWTQPMSEASLVPALCCDSADECKQLKPEPWIGLEIVDTDSAHSFVLV